VLVEFTDCIIQAKDLLSYDIVVDDDKQRSLRRQQEKQAREEEMGFANSLKIKPIYHQETANEFGIIKDPAPAP
jgi:hypothetical protein